MNLAQADSEVPSKMRRKRRKKTVAKQAEMPFVNQSFRLVGESSIATEFIEPVAPDRAAELFDQIKLSLA